VNFQQTKTKELRNAIVDLLTQHPGLNRVEISQATNKTGKELGYILKCMRDDGLIDQIGSRCRFQYFTVGDSALPKQRKYDMPDDAPIVRKHRAAQPSDFNLPRHSSPFSAIVAQLGEA